MYRCRESEVQEECGQVEQLRLTEESWRKLSDVEQREVEVLAILSLLKWATLTGSEDYRV